jgi:DNA-binding transcriptional ArsR family regulator
MNMDELERRAEMLKVLLIRSAYAFCAESTHITAMSENQETLGLTQSGLSQHISKLRAAGITRERKRQGIAIAVVDETALHIVDMMFEG